ncbi:transcriptional regulator [Acinetobacter radioresistens]|uniref:transcriptional regulator n=1 Tax=Acinetobacter radioresistens TaxID=40216 RepID=UPI00321278CB
MSINDNFLKRGERLKGERKRLKLTQPALAELLGVGVGSIVRYEKQGDPLNQNQLIVLKDAGFDVFFITFGERATVLAENEYEVLTVFRGLPDDAKKGFSIMAKAYAQTNATS